MQSSARNGKPMSYKKTKTMKSPTKTYDNKAYRPNAHLLYIVMHYNGNIMVIMAFTLFTFTFTLLF